MWTVEGQGSSSPGFPIRSYVGVIITATGSSRPSERNVGGKRARIRARTLDARRPHWRGSVVSAVSKAQRFKGGAPPRRCWLRCYRSVNTRRLCIVQAFPWSAASFRMGIPRTGGSFSGKRSWSGLRRRASARRRSCGTTRRARASREFSRVAAFGRLITCS